MALFVHHSPMRFFDPFIADYYRQMSDEMDRMRRRMIQLIPPTEMMMPVFTGGDEFELEPRIPIIEDNGERKMKLEFNVKDYKPEEVTVKMFGDNVLQVSAEHEESNEKGETRRRLFMRQYRLPKGVDVGKIKPALSKDGVLLVEAPAPGLAPSERLIPIEYQPGDAA